MDAKINKVVLSAVVTRADGTEEDLGVIAETNTEGVRPKTLLEKIFDLKNKKGEGE